MEKKESERSKVSWFWKWFLNNQVVTGLLVILLCLLIILLFTKVSYLFTPVWQFFGIVGFPIVFAGILYYFLNPLVNILENRGIKRVWAITIIFIGIIALMAWGIIILVPKIQEQTLSFLNNWPSYWKTIEGKTTEWLGHPMFDQYVDQLEKISESLFDSVGNIVKNLSKTTFEGIGSFIGTVANVFITVITTPFILFYLLKDGKDMMSYFINFLPTKARKPTTKVLIDINNQVSQYIRGQLTVAFAVAVMFVIGFSLIGLDYSITLGILAGFLNLIPYLGSFLATIPALILGLVIGPSMLIKVVIVFIIEQVIEGRFVSPLVLGSQLKIHPITIIFVLLTAGKLFGVVGVIVGIPGYAAIKVVVTHFFEWYRDKSSLYEEETTVIEVPDE
ncbi:AI-2E family transporter [uncultured Vagococcus sp.]|uniref:AI-2E family transporter n=1 Tax=uncultured Vagococcus sp. TaxID=189676 RepID=UPI0028D6A834|nr:AI-2E family transporter [uncultured Vagococcus sp.]